MGEIAVGIIILIMALPFLFGALKESGRIKMPKMGKPKSSFRQYPLHPPVQGGGDDIEIY